MCFFALYGMSFVYCQYRMLCEYVVYCGCKSCIVSVCHVCSLSYLHYCQHSVSCVCPVLYLHYCQRLVMSVLVLYCTHVCLHYCQCSVLSMQVQYCVCTTASAVCYVSKTCIVFALLPAQCAVCISHYC